MKYFDDEAELNYLQNNLEMVKLAKYIDKQQFGFLSMYFDLDTMEKECRKELKKAKRKAKKEKYYKDIMEYIEENSMSYSMLPILESHINGLKNNLKILEILKGKDKLSKGAVSKLIDLEAEQKNMKTI